MWPKSEEWGHKNFDSKNFSTVLLKKIKKCKKLYEYVSIGYKLSETLTLKL